MVDDAGMKGNQLLDDAGGRRMKAFEDCNGGSAWATGLRRMVEAFVRGQ